MIKIIDNSFKFKESSIKVLKKIHGLCKTASEDTNNYLKNIKSTPGRTKVLALFLGAGEFYGPNKNGDYFAESELIEHHKTFKQFAYVYRNHQNKDSSKKSGDIEFVTYNYKMHRVEGVLSLINNKCQDELKKIKDGIDVSISMAAKVPYDICSICNNKATSFAEYCDHLKYEMTDIYPDGRIVCAYNIDPRFIDLSIVWHPADQTAYFLKKVASDGKKDYNIFKFKKKSEIGKKSIIKKLSELEKHIEGIIAGTIGDDSSSLLDTVKRCIPSKELKDDSISELKEFPLSDVLSTLTNNKFLLTLKEFLKLINKNDIFSDVSKLMPSSFQRLNGDNLCDFGNMDENILPIKDLVRNLLPERAIDRDSISNKILNIEITKKPVVRLFKTDKGSGFSFSKGKGKIIIKKSSEQIASNLCNVYSSYKMKFFEKNPSPIVGLVIAANNYFN